MLQLQHSVERPLMEMIGLRIRNAARVLGRWEFGVVIVVVASVESQLLDECEIGIEQAAEFDRASTFRDARCSRRHVHKIRIGRHARYSVVHCEVLAADAEHSGVAQVCVAETCLTAMVEGLWHLVEIEDRASAWVSIVPRRNPDTAGPDSSRRYTEGLIPLAVDVDEIACTSAAYRVSLDRDGA